MAGGRKWTEKEHKFLRENYGVLSKKEIAAKLNRTVGAISNKISYMGLYKGNKTTKHDKIAKMIKALPAGTKITTVKYHGIQGKPKSRAKCTVLRHYDKYLLLQRPNYKESVLLADLISGRVVIEGVEA